MSGPLLLSRASRWRNGLPVFLTTTERDLAIPTGVAGEACYVDDGTATEGLYVHNGTSWRPNFWNHPWGRIISAVVLANQASITTVTDITGATVSFTAVLRRIYWVWWMAFPSSSVTTDIVAAILADGSNVARGETQTSVPAATTHTGFLEFSSVTGIALSAGAQVLKLRMQRSVGTGGVTNNAGAGFPTQIAVFDAGPDTGAPT